MICKVAGDSFGEEAGEKEEDSTWDLQHLIRETSKRPDPNRFGISA